MVDFERAGTANIIHEDEIYECLACNKMYTEQEMHAHEGVCPKIPEYLEWLKTQELDNTV